MVQRSEALKDNKLAFEEITVHLAQLEREAGNWQQAINWFQAAQNVSPDQTRCNSGLTKSKKPWRRKPMLRRLPLSNRKIALCFSRAALV